MYTPLRARMPSGKSHGHGRHNIKRLPGVAEIIAEVVSRCSWKCVRYSIRHGKQSWIVHAACIVSNAASAP
eukprot:12496494-Alexandrium_andersonii.AAC.1